MRQFSFWRKWLFIVALYHIVFGLTLAFFSQSPLMDKMLNQYFDPIFWPDNSPSSGTMHYKAWTSAVLGAVVASWAILIAFIAHYPFRLREKWAWNSVTFAVLLWFAVDTGCSLYFDVGINAMFNLFTLFLFALPLTFTRKYFHGRNESA